MDADRLQDRKMTGRWRRGACGALRGGLLVLVLSFAAAPLSAGEPDWPPGPYRYLVINQKVADALAELGRNIGVPVRVSDAVEGRLNGGLPVGTAREFLQRICDSYGLVWYFDGSVLHVNAESELRTEILDLGRVSPERLVRRLAELGIADERFTTRVPEEGGVLSVSGPPPYLSLVRTTLDRLAQPVRPRIAREVAGGDSVSVRVFRGRSGGS